MERSHAGDSSFLRGDSQARGELRAPMLALAQQPERVSIDNFSFSPAALTVQKGATVVWVNHDDVPHTVVSAARDFSSKALDTNDEFSHVFPSPGTYAYFCSVHPHMTGQIIVK